MKKGIAIAGTIVADIVKKIERYPVAGMMTSITDVSYGYRLFKKHMGVSPKASRQRLA